MTAAQMPIQSQSVPATPRTGMMAEPVLALPTAAMCGAIVLGGGLSLGAWWVGSLIFESMQGLMSTALAGIGLVMVIYLATGMLIMPWKPRRMGDWMNFWMGATVVRLLGTPVAAWLLYSAAFGEVRTLGLAVALSYVLCLFLETGTLAWVLNRRLAPNDDSTSASAGHPAGSAGGADQP